jgi:hypothetical protein
MHCLDECAGVGLTGQQVLIVLMRMSFMLAFACAPTPRLAALTFAKFVRMTLCTEPSGVACADAFFGREPAANSAWGASGDAAKSRNAASTLGGLLFAEIGLSGAHIVAHRLPPAGEILVVASDRVQQSRKCHPAGAVQVVLHRLFAQFATREDLVPLVELDARCKGLLHR